MIALIWNWALEVARLIDGQRLGMNLQRIRKCINVSILLMGWKGVVKVSYDKADSSLEFLK